MSEEFRILQYIVHNSSRVTSALLARPETALNYDIIAVQEPWLKQQSCIKTSCPTGCGFWQAEIDKEGMRVCLLINKNIATTA